MYLSAIDLGILKEYIFTITISSCQAIPMVLDDKFYGTTRQWKFICEHIFLSGADSFLPVWCRIHHEVTEGVLTVVDGVEVNVRLVRIRVRVTTGPARATLGKQSIDPIRRVQVEVQCEPAHDYHSHLRKEGIQIVNPTFYRKRTVCKCTWIS